MPKLNLAILFGGKSAEHEVSLKSAKNVIEAVNEDKYNLILIGISKDGRWYMISKEKIFSPNEIKINEIGDEVCFPSGGNGQIYNIPQSKYTLKADVVFPILHGPFGEDGTVQGLLKLAGVPFVGPSILGSAVGMDKEAMKRLLQAANLPIGKFIAIQTEETPDLEKIVQTLAFPIFVKPANLGSSVGISKAENMEQLKKAMDFAFEFDRKIILEEYIPGREIECAVLGNEEPIASLPGEVIPTHNFYSYEAKYLDDNGAELSIPAKLPADKIAEVQKLAIQVFKTLYCEGLSRVDFFLRDNGQLIINEINTIPGFTNISMYPKLFEASGINYSELIDKLITFAIERFNHEKGLKTNK